MTGVYKKNPPQFTTDGATEEVDQTSCVELGSD